MDERIEIRDRRRHGFFIVDNEIIDVYGAQIGVYGVAVYSALARFANADAECWPSLATLGARLNASRSSVIRALAKLEEVGLIARSVFPPGPGLVSSIDDGKR